MSSIEKMLVQGIRSFGPDERDRQIIEFFKPLTLILGPNGTGKTTVIECLKYMTTGEMPPGGKKEAAFIHDPKIAGEAEVKAQVRLQFKDVRGQHCVAHRSLTATQKHKKVELKTLEGVITRRDEHGNKLSVSSKCAEMDREMVALLGVSKAVLDNVIFVHQEEANWPLSEGKALKLKFDDIFASTRYVKALDSIQKFKKEQTIQIKLFQNDIKYLKVNRDKAAQIRGDLAEIETRYMASKETVDKIVEKLEPIQQKLEQIRSKAGDIYDLRTKIEKLKSEKEQMERAQQELKDNIENEFKGTREELQQTLRNFQKKVQEKEDKLEEVEGQLGAAEREYAVLSREKSKLLLAHGKMEQEAERHRDSIQKRQDSVKKFAERYEIKGYSRSVADGDAARFVEVLGEKAQEVLAVAKVTRAEYEEREGSILTQLDQQKKLKTKLETERKMKSENMKKNREEIRQINQELSRVEASGERLGDVQRELRRADLELSEAEKSVNLEGLRSEVQQLQKDKAQQDAKLKQLDSEMSRLTQESTARTQLELFRKDKTAKEDQRRRTCSKIEDSMRHLVGHMPADNMRKVLDECNSRLSRTVRAGNDKLRLLRGQLMEKETQRKMKMEQLSSKETELKECEQRLLEVSSSQNFDEGLDKLQVELKKAQEEEGQLKAVKVLYNKYQGNLEQSDPVCPLCHRPFDTETEVDELIGEIGQKLTLVPDRLERASQKIHGKQGQVEQMLQMKPTRAAMKDLSDTEIPKLKNEIAKLNVEIQHLQNDIGEKDEEIETLTADEQTAQHIQTDVSMIDRFYGEIRDLDRKISAQASKLTGGDSERSMQDVQTEREDLQMQLEVINRNLDRKRQKISEHSERVQRLKADLNELKGEKLQIESDLQQRTRLEENKVELEANNEALDREVRGNSEQLQPLQGKIEDLSAEKQSISEQKEMQYEKEKEQFRKIKENQNHIKQISSDIDRYVHDGKEQNLKDSRGRMKDMEGRAHKLEQEREILGAKMDELKEELAMQKTRKRELEDNMAAYKKEEEIGRVSEQIKELTEKLGGLDVSNLAREQKTLERQQERLTEEKHTAKGRQVELEDKIRSLKKELREDMYREADEKYRDKMIALRTTELANQDLDKYYKALDRTIMSYHHTKMSDINKTIRELWRSTYRGNDIETIEIKSDDDEGGANKQRRTYHYRVVMKKANTELDMRGRCSAGQKVLASLIIRLALAETFCLNCGILALDEPTTNLDRENIESLAYALVEIIKSRAQQRNFQLLVITHDEDFVELLGRSDYVEEFFKVKKNDFGLSCLTKARVSDLHSK